LIIFALGQLAAQGTGAMAASSKSQRAIWSIIAMVDGDARSTFLGGVAKLADEEAFAIRTSQPRQDGVNFLEPVPDAVVEVLADHLREVA
jgi:hypothetical protein